MPRTSIALIALSSLAAAQAQPEAYFTQGVRVAAAGAPIDVIVGHAAPLVFDFDGDGLRDLLVGEYGDVPFPAERLPENRRKREYDQGKLRIYRNVGTNTAPAFEDFEYLRAGKEHASIPTT